MIVIFLIIAGLKSIIDSLYHFVYYVNNYVISPFVILLSAVLPAFVYLFLLLNKKKITQLDCIKRFLNTIFRHTTLFYYKNNKTTIGKDPFFLDFINKDNGSTVYQSNSKSNVYFNKEPLLQKVTVIVSSKNSLFVNKITVEINGSFTIEPMIVSQSTSGWLHHRCCPCFWCITSLLRNEWITSFWKKEQDPKDEILQAKEVINSYPKISFEMPLENLLVFYCTLIASYFLCRVYTNYNPFSKEINHILLYYSNFVLLHQLRYCYKRLSNNIKVLNTISKKYNNTKMWELLMYYSIYYVQVFSFKSVISYIGLLFINFTIVENNDSSKKCLSLSGKEIESINNNNETTFNTVNKNKISSVLISFGWFF